MSAEMITMIVGIVGAIATIFGGMYVMLQRLETRITARFEQVDARFSQVDARFDKIEKRSDARFDRVDEELREMRGDIIDLKVAVARIEGPQQTLLPSRG